MGAAAVNATIAPWFVSARPAALSMAYNDASVGGVIFSSLWVMLIASSGFTQAAVVVGISMVTIVVALSVLAFSKSPDALGQFPDGARPDHEATAPLLAAPIAGALLWRDRRFLTLAAGMAAGLFAQIGLLAHLFSIMVPVFGSRSAGLLMGGATVAAILRRTGIGWLMPVSADRRLIASASYGVQIIGTLMLRPRHRQRHIAPASHRPGGVRQSRSLPRGAADCGSEAGYLCPRSRTVRHGQDDLRSRRFHIGGGYPVSADAQNGELALSTVCVYGNQAVKC
jgi:hypothetical protein